MQFFIFALAISFLTICDCRNIQETKSVNSVLKHLAPKDRVEFLKYFLSLAPNVISTKSDLDEDTKNTYKNMFNAQMVAGQLSNWAFTSRSVATDRKSSNVVCFKNGKCIDMNEVGNNCCPF